MTPQRFGVVVREVFPATHQLPLPQGGFEPLHGHDWEAVVELAGKRLDKQGVLVDFLDLQKALRETLKPFRYKCLNDVKAFEKVPPSAEAVAQAVYTGLRKRLGRSGKLLTRVTVTEAPGCQGWYGC